MKNCNMHSRKENPGFDFDNRYINVNVRLRSSKGRWNEKKHRYEETLLKVLGREGLKPCTK